MGSTRAFEKHEWEFFVVFFGWFLFYLFIRVHPTTLANQFFWLPRFAPRSSSVRAWKQIKLNDFDGWGEERWLTRRIAAKREAERGAGSGEKCVRSDYCYYIRPVFGVYLYNCRQIVFTAPAADEQRSLFTHFPIANSQSFSSFFFALRFYGCSRTQFRPLNCIRGLEDGEESSGCRGKGCDFENVDYSNRFYTRTYVYKNQRWESFHENLANLVVFQNFLDLLELRKILIGAVSRVCLAKSFSQVFEENQFLHVVGLKKWEMGLTAFFTQ